MEPSASEETKAGLPEQARRGSAAWENLALSVRVKKPLHSWRVTLSVLFSLCCRSHCGKSALVCSAMMQL
jgi:hypothetical protein